MLEVTYAFIGYIMGCVSLIISLYVWMILDEALENGRDWVKLNQELRQRLEQMERSTPGKR